MTAVTSQFAADVRWSACTVPLAAVEEPPGCEMVWAARNYHLCGWYLATKGSASWRVKSLSVRLRAEHGLRKEQCILDLQAARS
jgi:hypothetical protein